VTRRPGQVRHWKHGWIPLDDYARSIVASRGHSLPSKDGPGPSLDLRGYDDLSPGLQAKIGKKLEELTGIPEPKLAKKVQDNLTRLYQAGDHTQADWYGKEGADIAARAAGIRRDFPSSQISQDQLTGMIAATSAKKRWLENKDFAEAIARTLAADQPFPVDQAMINDYNAWATRRHAGLAKPHPELKPGTYRPSELPTDFAASRTPGMKKHINTDVVIRAAMIYQGDVSLDEAIAGPKQRSFVNNLMDPSDKRFVTVDTWHYKAAMQGIPIKRTTKGGTFNYTLEQWQDRDLARADGRAAARGYDFSQDMATPKNIGAIKLAADGMSPQTFFQGSPSSVAEKFKDGTYPWFVKQTQIVAEREGVSPNAVQAVAWYAVGGGA